MRKHKKEEPSIHLEGENYYPKQKKLTRTQMLFLKTIKPVSFNLEGASFSKEGPMFTIVAEKPGESFAFYWITVNLDTGELFITDVKDFHDECDRQGIESAYII